jgi:hypothetical protein
MSVEGLIGLDEDCGDQPEWRFEDPVASSFEGERVG